MEARPTSWQGSEVVGYTRCNAIIGPIVRGNIEGGKQCMNVAEIDCDICESEACMHWRDVEDAMEEDLYNYDDDVIEEPLE